MSESSIIKSFLTGIKRKSVKPPQQKLGMNKSLLKNYLLLLLGGDMHRSFGTFKQSLWHWRTAILELLLFRAMARFDDLNRLRFKNLSFSDNAIQIQFESRKNDQFKKGHVVNIEKDYSMFSPFLLLHQYIERLKFALFEAKKPWKNISKISVFPRIIKHNSVYVPSAFPVCYGAARESQISVLKALNKNNTLFGLHSGRLGSTQEAAAKGATWQEVNLMGGWSANSNMPQRYAVQLKENCQRKVSNF